MKRNALPRNIAATSRIAVALILCALPAFAQDEDSDAASAQQGGHYEARPDDGADEAEETPAPIPPPAARARTVPRVFRARPGGIHAEPNQETASPGIVEDGVLMGGAGVSQGAADKKIGQGSGSSSGGGGGGGGGFSDGPLGGGPATQTGGGSNSGKDLCAEQGLANAEVVYDHPGGWHRIFKLGPKRCLSMKMVIPPDTPDQWTDFKTAYDGVSPADWSFSENKCDFSPSLGACGYTHPNAQTRSGLGGRAVISTKKSPLAKCVLTPGKTYYLNIKRANFTGGLGTVWLWVSGFGNCNPNPTNGPVTCHPTCSGSECVSLEYVSANPGSSPGHRAPQPANPFPPPAPQPTDPQPTNPQPQQPSPTCWIGTSGAGSWSLSTAALEVSPPPPPCDACVRAGGHCEPGSSCTVAGGNGHYSCQ